MNVINNPDNDKTETVITIVRGEHQFLWNLNIGDNYTGVGEPAHVDQHQGFQILTRVELLEVFNCNDSECDQMYSKIITFYRNNRNNNYMYNYTDLTEQNTEIIPLSMPNNIHVTGDPTEDYEYNIWPKDWINQTNPCVAIDYTSKQLLYIMNADNSSQPKTVVMRVSNNPFNRTNVSREEHDIGVHFVGFFNIDRYNHTANLVVGYIYGVTYDRQTNTSYVYEYSTNTRQFEHSGMDFKRFMKCPKDETNSLIVIIIFLVIVAVMVVSCIAFMAIVIIILQTNSSNKKQTRDYSDETKSRATDLSTAVKTVQTMHSETGEHFTQRSITTKQ
ncbi:unnamed protein product [Medioppia subpectinata]|uniref:Uncharacterized protein n=1 Tax=Medioppia subpectinata TaxID=1979941 RepID=A0A7R9Q2M3_9ACAR|nr:unnamed protein product [Medioppia subpectinata]CAG2110340.1 unnamed protein product [Medioppia subpectinata]